MREGELEIIVTHGELDQRPRVVPFEVVYPSRDTITSLTLLWDSSSYYINVKEKYFIICGGRKVQPNLLEGFDQDKLKIFLAKRHQQDFTLGSEEKGEHRLYYCLGITDDTNYLFLQITEDGKWWVWRDKR